MGSGWTAFRLQRLGVWNTQNVALFPVTTEIIKSLGIPLAVRGVMFAKQVANSGVKPHSDGRNFILTCHLGLSVPRNCWIAVGGDRREWAENKAIVFDTSFTHETYNDSEEDRFVLIIDFWHPELTSAERQALEFIYDARNKFEAGKAETIEASYVAEGKTLDVKEYENSKKGFGKLISDFLKPFK
jgi:aspartate beta-hydroxylase